MIRNLFLFYFIRFGKLKPVVLIAIHAKVQQNAHNVPAFIICVKEFAMVVAQLDII